MSSRKKNPGPGAPSKSMERLAWPETAEYTVLMRDLSTLLQDRTKHPWDAPSRPSSSRRLGCDRREKLERRTRGVLSRLGSLQTKLSQQFVVLGMARDMIMKDMKQTTATMQAPGSGQDTLVFTESNLKIVCAIMRDFHARVANFIQNANLREDEQKWQKKFEMALEIPRTQSIPGVPDNERHKVIEGYLEVLKEKFPLVSDNHATMTKKASQSGEASIKLVAISKKEQKRAEQAAYESVLSKKTHIKFETGAELETTGKSVGIGGGTTAVGEHIAKKRKLCMEGEKELISVDRQLVDHQASLKKKISETAVSFQPSDNAGNTNVSGNEIEPWLGDGLLTMLEEEAKLL